MSLVTKTINDLKELNTQRDSLLVDLEKSQTLKEHFDLSDDDFPIKINNKYSYPGKYEDKKYYTEIINNKEYKELKIGYILNSGKEIEEYVINLPDIIKPKELQPFFKYLNQIMRRRNND